MPKPASSTVYFQLDDTQLCYPVSASSGAPPYGDSPQIPLLSLRRRRVSALVPIVLLVVGGYCVAVDLGRAIWRAAPLHTVGRCTPSHQRPEQPARGGGRLRASPQPLGCHGRCKKTLRPTRSG